MANYIDNDYTINLNSKTLNQGRESSKVVYSVSSTETTSTEEVSTTSYFSSQSMNSYNHDLNEGQGFFGQSVAIVNSSKILIGTPHKNHAGHTQTPGDVGSVFEYTYTEGVTDSDGSPWVQSAEISGNLSLMDTQKRMHFGTALAATGSYVAVGAPGLDGEPGNQAQNNGAVFIFKSSSSGYVEENMFRPQDTGSSAQYFGSVVSFDCNSNRLAVNGQNMENVYIFNSNSVGWQREAILTSSLIGYSTPDFGHSLALSGAYLAVGAPASRQAGNLNEGSVSVFKSSSVGWAEIVNVSSSNPIYNGLFGLSLDIMSNKRIIVGEPEGHPSNNKTGSVEIIGFDDLGNYNRIQLIENPRDNNYGAFGRNVSAYESGEFIVISRPLSNDNGTNNSHYDGLADFEEHRALFVYELSGSNNWNLSGTLTRDVELATYYDNNPGDWFYGTTYAKNGFHVPLDVKDGLVLLGIEDASDNNFRRTPPSNPFGYNFGEFRVWKTEVTTTTIETTSTTETVTTTNTAGDFVPFRFHLNGPVNTRGQVTSKAYKSFLGDPKS